MGGWEDGRMGGWEDGRKIPILIQPLFSVQVFLGIQSSETELLQEFKEFSSQHWHGVVALPFNISIPLWGNTGTTLYHGVI